MNYRSLMGPPQPGMRVRINIPTASFYNKEGVVQNVIMDNVTLANIVEVKLDSGLVVKFFEDVLQVI